MATQRLNQVVAVEKKEKQNLNKDAGEILKALQKQDLFDGHAKVYQPKAEGGDTLPDENKHVQKIASAMLKEAESLWTKYLDICATRDFANCEAKVDLVVDGTLLLEKVPATFLLFLEHQLTEYATVIAALPTLDPAEKWGYDESSGLQKSAVRETQKTAKTQKPIVLYDATDKHPAQTQLIAVDEVVGYWSTTKLSGAVPVTLKKNLAARVDSLIKAVKQAREEANCTPAPTKAVGNKLFAWIWSGLKEG
jgi:hypothetical protein